MGGSACQDKGQVDGLVSRNGRCAGKSAADQLNGVVEVDWERDA